MWIDPGEVVIKSWWSYYQRGVEETIFPTTSVTSPKKLTSPNEPTNEPSFSTRSPGSYPAQPPFYPATTPPMHYHYPAQNQYSPGTRYPVYM